MEKILVISSTNRPESNTIKVSRQYLQILKSMDVESEILDFRELPHDISFSEMYGNRTEDYKKLIEKYIHSHNKIVFVAPEYNGSFPGILKTFLDSLHPREWAGKKICLVGVSDGRAGNSRGMDHLVSIFHYLKTHVYFHNVPISKVNEVMNQEGIFISEAQIDVCKRQLKGFLEF